MTNYTVKRSNRKTLSITVNKDAKVTVHAPLHIKNSRIADFVEKNREWIENRVKKAEIKNREIFNIPKELIPEIKIEAVKRLTPIIEKYTTLLGLKPSGVKITSAKTRLGSCNSKNSLCFSVYLLNYPEEVIEYVVLHELSHIKHKNHSSRFYELIEKHMPDYKDRIRAIRDR